MAKIMLINVLRILLCKYTTATGYERPNAITSGCKTYCHNGCISATITPHWSVQYAFENTTLAQKIDQSRFERPLYRWAPRRKYKVTTNGSPYIDKTTNIGKSPSLVSLITHRMNGPAISSDCLNSSIVSKPSQSFFAQS